MTTRDESKEWAAAGFTLVEESDWVAAGFSVGEAVEWRDHDFGPYLAAKWKEFFGPDDAEKWYKAGVDPEEARERAKEET